MSVPAYKREAINRLGGRLSATLRRCEPRLPQSLRAMAVRVVKEAITRRLDGKTEIHPGIGKLAKWGGCSQRQARRNVRAMENWGLMQPTAHAKGGKYYATQYFVDPEVLVRVMMTLGANPSVNLIAELRDINPDIKADTKADITPGHKGGHMSARIRSTQNPSQNGGGDSDA